MVDSGRRSSVKALDESKRLPLLVRWRLRREQRKRRTGILVFAEIREPLRSLTYKAGIVSLWDNGVELCSRSRDTKMPKFVELPPGLHRIDFKVIRVRAGKSTSFLRDVDLEESEILVALCDPVQSNVFYRRSPDTDTWVVGVLSPQVANDHTWVLEASSVDEIAGESGEGIGQLKAVTVQPGSTGIKPVDPG